MIASITDTRNRALRENMERSKRMMAEAFDILIASLDEMLASTSFTTDVAEPEAPIDAAAVAKIIGRDVSTVRELARAKAIPSYLQPGTGSRGKWTFYRSEIDAWIRNSSTARVSGRT